MISAEIFTSFGGILSGPVAFDISIDFIILLISSLVAKGRENENILVLNCSLILTTQGWAANFSIISVIVVASQ